uniref:Putative secreted peptide n=1 Tax=Anopheles braziliensis TaxID=58242 RepID=A0A2M3ZWG7_9DIPT
MFKKMHLVMSCFCNILALFVRWEEDTLRGSSLVLMFQFQFQLSGGVWILEHKIKCLNIKKNVFRHVLRRQISPTLD